MAPHTPARRLAGREMEMSRKLILTAILAIASSFNAVAHVSDVNEKSLAAAEATYAKSALVFQQMRETRK
jgi:predicted Zn-dependent protease